MAFTIEVGGGVQANVEPPERTDFDDNLGGAIQFHLSNVLYKLLQFSSGVLGEFMAGVFVRFFDRLEPGLVEYTLPFIDQLRAVEGLPTWLSQTLDKLANPEHEAAAPILAQIGGQGMSSALSTIMDATLLPIAYAVNAATKNKLPDTGDIMAMYYRGLISESDKDKGLNYHGWTDTIQAAYNELLRTRPSIPDILEAYRRKIITRDDAKAKIMLFGMSADETEAYITANERQIDVATLLSANLRGVIGDENTETELGKLGFNASQIGWIMAGKRRLLDPATYYAAHFRGGIPDDAFNEALAASGYTEAERAALDSANEPMPGPSDLVRMALREAWDDQVASNWGYDDDYKTEFGAAMTKWGYDPEWARRYWRAHWELPSVSMGMEMLHRRIISAEQFAELLRIADYPSGWRDKMTQVSYNPLTRVDVRRMHAMGVLDDEAVLNAYKDLGYDDTNAAYMLEFTKRYNSGEGENPAASYKSATRATVITAYRKNILTHAEAVTRLTDLGYTQDAIELYLEIADFDQEVTDTPDYRKEYEKDLRSILERAYADRIMTGQEVQAQLEGLGYSQADAALVVEALSWWRDYNDAAATTKLIEDAYEAGNLDRSTAQSMLAGQGIASAQVSYLLQTWDTKLALPSKRLTEAQYRAAVKAGVISVAQYQDALRGMGYGDFDIDIAVRTYGLAEG